MTVLRPLLHRKVGSADSRTERFVSENFGARGRRHVAVELCLATGADQTQLLLVELLVDLLLRMDPVVEEVRIASPAHPALTRMWQAIATRVPCEVVDRHDPSLEVLRLGVGSDTGDRSVDATAWQIGFDGSPIRASEAGIVGPSLAALEAAKYFFFIAAAESNSTGPTAYPWPSLNFDAWLWRWSTEGIGELRLSHAPTDSKVVLVGCGGVGAAYLWFLRQSGMKGKILLIDDDRVEWHNMNRLLCASVEDADAGVLKVDAAKRYLGAAWDVATLPRKAEHAKSIGEMKAWARDGAFLVSAVGDPSARALLAQLGFLRVFDGATNGDGSAQVLSLSPGVSSCIECHLRRPNTAQMDMVPARPRCGIAQTAQFAGVAPHLSAYAGILLGIEHLRAVLSAGELLGSNTQSIMRPLDEYGRVPTNACSACPFRRTGDAERLR